MVVGSSRLLADTLDLSKLPSIINFDRIEKLNDISNLNCAPPESFKRPVMVIQFVDSWIQTILHPVYNPLPERLVNHLCNPGYRMIVLCPSPVSVELVVKHAVNP